MSLAAIVPPAVAVVEGPVAWAAHAPLLDPAEERSVARAVPRRRNEYAAGRTCARRALAQLGVPPGAVLSGPRREPLWPAGVVGSITHTAEYAAAAVARAADLAALGVDAENPVPAELVDLVCTDGERRWCAVDPPRRLVLIFSAKESVFKAVYPLTRQALGFRDVRIEAAGGLFRARSNRDGPSPLDALEGAYRHRGGRVFTAAWIRA